MRPGAKQRLRLFLENVMAFAGGAGVFGALVSSAYFPNDPLRGAAFGVLGGMIGGGMVAAFIAGAEIFLPRTRLGHALERWPFLAVLFVKSFLYGGVVLLLLGSKFNRWIAARLVWGADAAEQILQQAGFPIVASITVTFFVMAFTILAIQFSTLVGARTLRSIILGRYHRPHIEERFFLFVDIVGSTPLAERLGPTVVHGFLDRVFQVASDPIDDHECDVYQYVGDEMVITWTLAAGRAGARPIACYFAIERALEAASGDFRREFDEVPHLRGALHAGPVITGEVGGSRRAIVFHGDVMNTTSRIENATRELGRPFLVSEDALRCLEGVEASACVDLGPQQLRGRAAPLRLFAVAPVNMRAQSA
jgi:adenylate cyclase